MGQSALGDLRGGSFSLHKIGDERAGRRRGRLRQLVRERCHDRLLEMLSPDAQYAENTASAGNCRRSDGE